MSGSCSTIVALCCLLNSSGKPNRRDSEWKIFRQWWDRIKITTLKMGVCGSGLHLSG